MMFSKILIANRGEIACRVAHTAKSMGIATVAVYSEADADAQHVKVCDEAWLIGPAAARDSYLKIDKILEIARQSGAEAIHPGYGFLSENAEFAKACEALGIVFIGPPASAINAMGSKSEAKHLMSEANVPLVPGYHGDEQSPEYLQQAADRIGYPLLIKASAGGGGKGMRVVEASDQFGQALDATRREAISSFGDDKVLLERYLQAPRHVELQIFVDSQGNAVHLFERDCSIQRRHQKVLEEAPAPEISEELRQQMGEAAIDAARAINYQGAGTVEFLLDRSGEFFFMEMNTRLQVEHPVTEMITGQDLVAWQLGVAAGEPLPLKQDQLAIKGHAIEARIYAETPDRDFLPATGKLFHLRLPKKSPQLRVDTGVVSGDEVTIHYDPMIAKLIVWGRDRDAALRRMRMALAQYQVVGVNTNLGFLSTLCALPQYARAELDTGFIERHEADLFKKNEQLPDEAPLFAALYTLLNEQPSGSSPWDDQGGWSLNRRAKRICHFSDQGKAITVDITPEGDGYRMTTASTSTTVMGEISATGELFASLDGERLKVTVITQGDLLTLFDSGNSWQLSRYDPRIAGEISEESQSDLIAPMPGTIISVNVKVGEQVEAGVQLVVIEAMKMEHAIKASIGGRIESINFKLGEQVEEGDLLLALEEN